MLNTSAVRKVSLKYNTEEYVQMFLIEQYIDN